MVLEMVAPSPILTYQIERGNPHPIGTTVDANGANFSIYADRATAVSLLLFHNCLDEKPYLTIDLDPTRNRTFDFWHVYIHGLKAGTHYAYRVDGSTDLHGFGDRYNGNKVLIDPYAKGNTDALWNRSNAVGPEDNVTTAMRSVVIDTANYDWEGDRPLNHELARTVAYEIHVRGFTQHPSSGVQHPGTFAGVIEKIPYLQELGVTSVELLPVFDFDEKNDISHDPQGKPLNDYWGYNPINFFSPQCNYCIEPDAGQHVREFRDMVKALHKADIAVILDVVFNHSGEGDHRGPTISHKGMANSTYYQLVPWDKQYYMNYSGAGNTINANHPLTEKQIIEALEYWVTEMHVDGFRFDEAVILCRDENGAPMIHPPVIWQIELSDVLANTKVTAEAWDAAGLYQVGQFPGRRWGEWNGRYRDAIRHFVKGDPGYLEGQTILGRVAAVIAGSADIFQNNGQLPTNSINFVTVHDGFTLNDLVSYNGKHNEANGQNNTDGIDNNVSWNCGFEGETTDPAVEALRERQIKNFAAILFLSQGVPLFVAGDEARRTQRGNNNAYCQDNEISWFDWTLVESNRGLVRFFSKMIAFRKSHRTIHRSRFFLDKRNSRGLAEIDWHGCRLSPPDWNDPSAHAFSFTMGGITDENGHEDNDIHVMLNMYWEDLDFDLPAAGGWSWYKVVDTSQQSPNDISENLLDPLDGTVIAGPSSYRVAARSIVVFISRP